MRSREMGPVTYPDEVMPRGVNTSCFTNSAKGWPDTEGTASSAATFLLLPTASMKGALEHRSK
jgi:hypothetical protein